MTLSDSHKARECPCYLHRSAPRPLSMAGPCFCECDVPHLSGNPTPPAEGVGR